MGNLVNHCLEHLLYIMYIPLLLKHLVGQQWCAAPLNQNRKFRQTSYFNGRVSNGSAFFPFDSTILLIIINLYLTIRRNIRRWSGVLKSIWPEVHFFPSLYGPFLFIYIWRAHLLRSSCDAQLMKISALFKKPQDCWIIGGRLKNAMFLLRRNMHNVVSSPLQL